MLYNGVSCPVCGNYGISDYQKKHSKYKLFCCECGIDFWYPLEFPVTSFYEDDSDYLLRIFDQDMSIPDYMHTFLKMLKTKNPKALLLDIGMGEGRFVRNAKEYGFDVW